MKLLLVVCVVLTVANALDKEVLQTLKQQSIDAAKNCALETGASEKDLKEFENRELPSRHQGMCLLYCVSKKLKFQDADGKINQATAADHLLPVKEKDEESYNIMKNVIETCIAEVSNDEDPCMTATNLMGCIAQKKKQMGLTDMAP